MRTLPVRYLSALALVAGLVACGGPVDADGNPIDDGYVEEAEGLVAIELPADGTGAVVVTESGSVATVQRGTPAAAQAFSTPGAAQSDSSPDPIPAHVITPTVVYLNGTAVVLTGMPSEDTTAPPGRRGGGGGDTK